MDEMLINVNVVLVSGRSICLSAQPSSSIGDLKAAAANGLGHRFLKLLSADGRYRLSTRQAIRDSWGVFCGAFC